ncbi:MAG: glycoside hydrolase family 13 protein [Oscillospiraceae bacterium]|nr:glycoside hydrolase family 13 protein [Oscillospiraceae bacterium]
MNVIFDSQKEKYKAPFGAVAENQLIRYSVFWDDREEVRFILCDESGSIIESVSMIADRGYFTLSYRFCDVGLFFYRFESGDKVISKAVDSSLGIVTDIGTGDWFCQLVYDKDYTAPKPSPGKIFYQIFPDRFYRSHIRVTEFNDRIIYTDTDRIPSYAEVGEHTPNNDFYGGNLQGIIEKLPYLASFNVGYIYLNPIFLSHSNHRYDTANYMKIDPLLGTESDFAMLCQTAKDYDISIILDGVFSHTGADSIYFDRFGRYGHTGGYDNVNSRYRQWYFFDDSKVGYRCWWGVYTLPELDENNEDFREFICGDNGVIDYWMSFGAGGFRLDVADELPDRFIEEIRGAVKKHGEDKLLIGEVWENAATKVSYGSRRRYLQGNQLDSIMNYPFRNSIIEFIRFGDAKKFISSVMEIVEDYPKPMMNLMMNLLSSHDTERLINALVAPCLGRNRHWQATTTLTHDEYLRGVEMAKLAFGILFTLPGIPSIYYGDEIGMTSYGDPFNRAYFRWDDIDENLFSYLCQLSKTCSRYLALADGDMVPVLAAESVVAYLRRNMHETILVIVNRSDSISNLEYCGNRYITEPWSVTLDEI